MTVRNTGSVAGSDIVQLYVSLPSTSELTHPPLMLKKFAKVSDLAPGKSTAVSLAAAGCLVSCMPSSLVPPSDVPVGRGTEGRLSRGA